MKVTVIGSGSWGTALAQVLADNRHDVSIWGQDLDEVVDIHMYHQNEKHFPGVHIHENIHATNDLRAVSDAQMVVLAIPSGFVQEVCNLINLHFINPVIVVNTAIGLDPKSHQRLSEIIRKTIKPELLEGVVSIFGTSYPQEVIRRMYTAVEMTGLDPSMLTFVQVLFATDYFNVSLNLDEIGCESAAAFKNVIAIACGILIGLGYGDNARATLLTQGLAEMKRYGIHCGGKPETYLGLSGAGDLIATCTGTQSHNFQAGLLIGKSDSAKAFWEMNNKTPEGALSARIIYEDSHKNALDLPITTQIYRILYENALPSQALKSLLKRDINREHIA
jgi:glycerol-3-phosphate dehydrogenase (NAD(P)+)